ncbi:MAG: hypothetical protein GOU98_00085 [Candidatus Altiarchaeota archaeon]|nr:hypothetical protein [Candidatus Altiarchaeota archaeon]
MDEKKPVPGLVRAYINLEVLAVKHDDDLTPDLVYSASERIFNYSTSKNQELKQVITLVDEVIQQYENIISHPDYFGHKAFTNKTIEKLKLQNLNRLKKSNPSLTKGELKTMSKPREVEISSYLTEVFNTKMSTEIKDCLHQYALVHAIADQLALKYVGFD